MLQIYRAHEEVWKINLPGDPYELRLWRVVMRAAYKKTHGLSLYQLPPAKQKKALRCDLCIPGKRKQASYADYETLTLYCDRHYVQALYTPDEDEEEDAPIAPWYELCGCFG